MKPITEDKIENFALELLQSLGWDYIHGLAIAPGAESSERESFEQIILINRLRRTVSRLNPDIPKDAQEQAIQKILRIHSPELLTNNEEFHKHLIEKIKVPYQKDGFERSYEVGLIDFDNPFNNEFLAVNQYTVVENNQNKRPDILLFINGIPLVVIELKNPVDEKATTRKAYEQLQTYKATIPSLFTYNAVCVISDGMECKAGSLSAGYTRYTTWKTEDGRKEASKFIPQLEVTLKGMFNPVVLLDLIRNFTVFQKEKKEDPTTGLIQIETIKILAAYHQYYAVNKAVEKTIQASSISGDRKGGVIWHTQGSGKSLSMVFYAGKLVQYLDNPTIVVLTDRNDLDDQLFDTFSASIQLLRQEPIQAESRDNLKELLKVAGGGIVFTTIQKFFPEEGKPDYDLLSDRRNIVVIADEAHRTQYGFKARLIKEKDKETKEVIGERIAYGFAKYMRDALPNATYIGYTGTPIELSDKNTAKVFGDYVDIYDIAQSVADENTVKIYYESRMAKVNLDEEGKRLITELDKELNEDEEINDVQRLKAKWAQLEAIVGNQDRLKNLAKDIIEHFQRRQEVLNGKAMVVAMSRRIAVDLYNEIIKIKPDWHNDDLSKGVIKVVMTAVSSDGPEMQKHHTNKIQRKYLASRFKDPDDTLKIVIVIDMWLTGFDVPCLHTMYIDKIMRGHNLMQAIARVNRVFKDKPGGLIVDYLGIATDLKKALSFYSNAGGKGNPFENQEKAVDVLMEKIEIIRQMFYTVSKSTEEIIKDAPSAYLSNYPNIGFNYKRFFEVDAREKMEIILQAEEHILGLEDGKSRYIREVSLMSQAFALSIPNEKALELKDEIAFFQAVKARLVKFEGTVKGKSDFEIETAIKQIVNEALNSEGVVDIYTAAGIEKPEISILSEEFLEEVKGMKHQNLAFELLKRLLNDEIRTRSRTNFVQSRALLEMLENAMKKYRNNLLSTAEIINELIEIAKEIKKADARGKELGLTEYEVAFYDALETNDSAVKILGDEVLKTIAREVCEKVRANATIDWTIRESARARLKVIVKRTLNKYGYPPDKQANATETVLKQAELLADDWSKEERQNPHK